MTDADLKKHLAALRVPPPDATTQERALHRATLALARSKDTAEDAIPASPSRSLPPAWGALAAAVALVLVAVAVLFQRKPSEAARVASVAPAGVDLRMLSQVEGLFPGQLNALVEHDGEVRLDLARQPSPGDSAAQPLLVQLEGFGQRLRVLSYSGRSVTLELKGGRITFEALVTGEGGIVLTGKNFAWTSAKPGLLAGYRIQAHPLASSL